MNLSPTLFYRCSEALQIISGRAEVSLQEMLAVSVSGRIPEEAINCLLAAKWIEVKQAGILSITDKAKDFCKPCLSIATRRELLRDVVVTSGEAWLSLIPYGRMYALDKAPEGVWQVFEECGLTDGTDADVVRFWDELAFDFRDRRDQNLTELGRAGERLSLEKESARTRCVPRWVALDDNTLGYDILSVLSGEDKSPLRVEVKYSSQSVNRASLFLSRNEWDIAESFGHHQFHLWSESEYGLFFACICVELMRLHIPVNSNKGVWNEATVPFSAFDDIFVKVETSGEL